MEVYKMTKKNTLTIRVSDAFTEQLAELCETWKMNKTQVLERLVYGAYCTDTKIGKEQINSVMEQFKNLNASLERLKENV